jgi:hypothetical protein
MKNLNMATNVGLHSLPCLKILEEGRNTLAYCAKLSITGEEKFYSKSPRVTELGLLLQNLIGVSIYILE